MKTHWLSQHISVSSPVDVRFDPLTTYRFFDNFVLFDITNNILKI